MLVCFLNAYCASRNIQQKEKKKHLIKKKKNVSVTAMTKKFQMALNVIWQREKGVRHSCLENSQQQMSRWLPTRWWRPEEARSWRPGDQRRAAWGRHRPRQRRPEVRRNPEPNRSSESRSLLTLDRLRFTSLRWGCQHWLRGPANCRRPLRRCKPPPSDCSRCTCPGWTCWTINESNTLIFF